MEFDIGILCDSLMNQLKGINEINQEDHIQEIYLLELTSKVKIDDESIQYVAMVKINEKYYIQKPDGQFRTIRQDKGDKIARYHLRLPLIKPSDELANHMYKDLKKNGLIKEKKKKKKKTINFIGHNFPVYMTYRIVNPLRLSYHNHKIIGLNY